jgi:tripartite-type tricarboxylate transporter receptor subunit TctC
MVVPNAAGGSSDLLARLFAAQLAEAWGEPVITDLRPGGAGRIATDAVAKAAPDGRTLLLANNGISAIVPAVGGNADGRSESLAPVTRLTNQPIVVAAAPAIAARTLAELIELARRTAGHLSYASGGIGSTSHMAAALLSRRAGITLVQIPYSGTATAVKDVLAGEIPLLFTHLATVASLVRSGQLRALAVTGARRVEAFPDIPTVAESGFPGFDVTTWHGVLVRAGTPAPIVARLHGELVRILAQPEIREHLASVGMEPVGNTPEQFAAELKADRAHWAMVNGSGPASE